MFSSCERQEIFLFSGASSLALKLNQLPVQCIPVALSYEEKWLQLEPSHFLESSIKVKNEWRCVATPHIWHEQDSFTSVQC